MTQTELNFSIAISTSPANKFYKQSRNFNVSPTNKIISQHSNENSIGKNNTKQNELSINLENEINKLRIELGKKNQEIFENKNIIVKLEEKLKENEKQIVEKGNENMELKKRRENARLEIQKMEAKTCKKTNYTNINEVTEQIFYLNAFFQNTLLFQLESFYKDFVNILEYMTTIESKSKFITLEQKINSIISVLKELSSDKNELKKAVEKIHLDGKFKSKHSSPTIQIKRYQF